MIVFILVDSTFCFIDGHFLKWPLDAPTFEEKGKKYYTFRQMIIGKINDMGQKEPSYKSSGK